MIVSIVLEFVTGEQVHLEPDDTVETDRGAMQASQLRTAWLDGAVQHVTIRGRTELEVEKDYGVTETVEAESLMSARAPWISRIFEVYEE